MGEDASAVASVRTFLDRYIALREGTDPARSHLREHDREAATLLEARKIIDRAIETELQSTLQRAELSTMAQASHP